MTRPVKETRRERERDTRIDDPPAVLDEPDVSLRTVVFGVVLETTDGPQRQRPLGPVLTVSRTRCCKQHDRGARAPTASQRSRRAQC